MGLLLKASNALARGRVGLARAAPIVHGVRRYADVVNAAVNSPVGSLLPGANIARAVTRGIQILDNATQKMTQ